MTLPVKLNLFAKFDADRVGFLQEDGVSPQIILQRAKTLSVELENVEAPKYCEILQAKTKIKSNSCCQGNTIITRRSETRMQGACKIMPLLQKSPEYKSMQKRKRGPKKTEDKTMIKF